MSGLLLGMVQSIRAFWFHNVVTLPSWLVSSNFGTWLYQCLFCNFIQISLHMRKCSWAHTVSCLFMYVGESKIIPHYRYMFCSWLYCWLGMTKYTWSAPLLPLWCRCDLDSPFLSWVFFCHKHGHSQFHLHQRRAEGSDPFCGLKVYQVSKCIEWCQCSMGTVSWHKGLSVNPLNPELNPICYLLALLGALHFLHVSRIRVKLLTFRLLMSYIWSTHSWCF